MKLTVSKSKNSASFYVQKSIRKPNGSTTTVTIEKLGNIDEVRTKAGGGDPYVWAQEYVNELNRKEYEDKQSVIVSYSPSRLISKDEQNSFNCGYLFLQDIYYKLGLNKICDEIKKRHSFEYDLNEILSKLVYSRIIYPSSKLSTYTQSKKFLEQPDFDLHNIYRALSVLASENDYIQSELYKNSAKITERNSSVLYYDCTNFFFEKEEEDELKKYGKSKQHQPLPIVGMGLFMDGDGIPLAFDIYPGNKNEQPTLKPLEQKVIKDFELGNIIVCTDAGLSSAANRRFNDKTINGVQKRSFITTQSIKMLPAHLKEFALDTDGWKLPGDNRVYKLSELDPDEYYEQIFYKDRWITEELTDKDKKTGTKPLEQHLIVSFSFKYLRYQRRIRQGQIDRARKIVDGGEKQRKAKTPNDPNRFIGRMDMTADGEACSRHELYLDEDAIRNEEIYDGFYAVCSNIADADVSEVIRINKRRWEIEECFRTMKTEFKARPVYLQKEDRIKAHFLTCFIALVIYCLLEKKLDEKYTCEKIIHTLRDMNMFKHSAKSGYSPAYTRTELTDKLHETAGFRTDYEIISELSMKKIIRATKKKQSASAGLSN